MINELSKNINKEVAITLINGKEKSGTVVNIDAESNTVRLRDETDNRISISGSGEIDYFRSCFKNIRGAENFGILPKYQSLILPYSNRQYLF